MTKALEFMHRPRMLRATLLMVALLGTLATCGDPGEHPWGR